MKVNIKNVEGVKRTDLYKIDPRSIKEEEGFNIREYDTDEVRQHIDGLCEAMLSGAFIPPITVRTNDNGEIVLIDGHCRHKAALKAIEQGAEGLMLTAVNFQGSDVERIGLMLRSGEGLKFQPLEVAKGYLRLKRMNISTADIAKSVGKSVSHVEQYLTLATSNHDVQKMVENGEVSATVAIQAVRKDGEQAGAKLKAVKTANNGNKVTAKAFKPSKAKIDAVIRSAGALAKFFEGADFSSKPEQLTDEEWNAIGVLLDAYDELGIENV